MHISFHKLYVKAQKKALSLQRQKTIEGHHPTLPREGDGKSLLWVARLRHINNIIKKNNNHKQLKTPSTTQATNNPPPFEGGNWGGSSTIMKKIFALAIALVSMAVSMTSCGNDDADFIERKAPKQEQSSNNGSEDINTEFDGKLYFAAYKSQFENVNNIYTVQVGGETMQVNVEDLPLATKLPHMIQKNLEEVKVKPNIYVYTIPAGMKGEIKVTCSWTAKENMAEKIDLYCGVGVNAGTEWNGLKGFQSEKLDALVARKAKTPFTTTLK